MVYRKLHQNVAAFNQYIEQVAQDFPGGKDALAAKFVGRWKNGAPLSLFPTQKEADEFIAKLKTTRDKYYQACLLTVSIWLSSYRKGGKSKNARYLQIFWKKTRNTSRNSTSFN